MNQPTKLTDNEFLSQFESLTLDPQYFNHIGHLRLAWLYVNEHSLENAIELTSEGIKAYAQSLGATDKYHATITHALVRIVAQRQTANRCHSWQQFNELNHDLVTDALGQLKRYYSDTVLFSDEAKQTVKDADIKSL